MDRIEHRLNIVLALASANLVVTLAAAFVLFLR
jgi:hypothetical protein